MKKQIFMITALVVLVMTFTACAKTNTQTAPMIKPTEFSAETKKVLALFEDDTMFFDFTVDDTIKSSTVTIWYYENGEWVNKGNSSGNIDKAGNQIAFRFTDSGYELFTIDESGHIKYTSPNPYTGFEATTQRLSTRLEDKTEIVVGTEIPLWVKLGNNSGEISIKEDFRTSDCTAGVAVTITFSGEVLS